MQNPYYPQHAPGQQYHQMHSSFNRDLLKQMSNQMGRMPGGPGIGDLDTKAMLHHQLRLGQEPM